MRLSLFSIILSITSSHQVNQSSSISLYVYDGKYVGTNKYNNKYLLSSCKKATVQLTCCIKQNALVSIFSEGRILWLNSCMERLVVITLCYFRQSCIYFEHKCIFWTLTKIYRICRIQGVPFLPQFMICL